MLKKIRHKILSAKINSLVKRLDEAKSLIEKAFIHMEANNLKSKYAIKLFNGKIDANYYAQAFKVKETDITNHYLDLYLKEKKEA